MAVTPALLTAFIILLTLIYLGSTIAYNAIVSLQMLAMMFTYMTSIGCLIWRRLYGDPLPTGSWSLGPLGMAINVSALMYCSYLLNFIPFPVAIPVTAVTLNWSSVLFSGFMLVSLVYLLAACSQNL